MRFWRSKCTHVENGTVYERRAEVLFLFLFLLLCLFTLLLSFPVLVLLSARRIYPRVEHHLQWSAVMYV